jgi:hypothetical protein
MPYAHDDDAKRLAATHREASERADDQLLKMGRSTPARDPDDLALYGMAIGVPDHLWLALARLPA